VAAIGESLPPLGEEAIEQMDNGESG